MHEARFFLLKIFTAAIKDVVVEKTRCWKLQKKSFYNYLTKLFDLWKDLSKCWNIKELDVGLQTMWFLEKQQLDLREAPNFSLLNFYQ